MSAQLVAFGFMRDTTIACFSTFERLAILCGFVWTRTFSSVCVCLSACVIFVMYVCACGCISVSLY